MAAPTLFVRPLGRASVSSVRSFNRCTPRIDHMFRSGPQRQQHVANFFSLPTSLSPGGSTSPALLSASRQLPYRSDELYAIIADVDAYSSFLPYCQHSRVTAWRTTTPPPAPPEADAAANGDKPSFIQQQRWPSMGDLTIGWGPLTESYTSRLYCIPGRVVEAVSGKGKPSITAEEAEQWGLDLEREKTMAALTSTAASTIFESLVTRWTVAPNVQQHQNQQRPLTNVELSIRYQFLNPLYQISLAKMGEEVAGVMIKAFEERARQLLRRSGGMKNE